MPQLEGWLRAAGADVTVLNAGVSGDTTAGGLVARRLDADADDVDAMIVALGGNDLLRGIDPAVSRANIDGILQAADDADVEVLLVGLAGAGQLRARLQGGVRRDLAGTRAGARHAACRQASSPRFRRRATPRLR